jgi:hypothetical protein
VEEHFKKIKSISPQGHGFNLEDLKIVNLFKLLAVPFCLRGEIGFKQLSHKWGG